MKKLPHILLLLPILVICIISCGNKNTAMNQHSSADTVVDSIIAKEAGDSGFNSFYNAQTNKEEIASEEDSVYVVSLFKSYLQMYDSACFYAQMAVPDPKRNHCILDYYLKAIDFLNECCSFDTAFTTGKVQNDHRFDGIRNEYEFQAMFYGLSFDSARWVRSFIVDKTYRTSAPGSSYYPIDELTIHNDNSWDLVFHKNAEEMTNYYLMGIGDTAPELQLDTINGTWALNDHELTLINADNKVLKTISLQSPGVIDNMFYPDPNDMSGNNEVRHYWQCGKCGCR
jgi:hypothetical protein